MDVGLDAAKTSSFYHAGIISTSVLLVQPSGHSPQILSSMVVVRQDADLDSHRLRGTKTLEGTLSVMKRHRYLYLVRFCQKLIGGMVGGRWWNSPEFEPMAQTIYNKALLF